MKKELKIAKEKLSLAKILLRIRKQPYRRRDFKKSISSSGSLNLIGELKIASPLKGILRNNLDLRKTARLYEKEGIKAISVLTNKHFQGKLSDIKKVKQAVNLPILRKDFIIDKYQIYESFLAGADAVLLIASLLSKKKLINMLNLLKSLNMAALVEVHEGKDLKKIKAKEAEIIGINNRNLKNFSIDLKTTGRLVRKIPRTKIIVSESGISQKKDILYLKNLGVNAALIGEGIVSAKNMAVKIRELLR